LDSGDFVFVESGAADEEADGLVFISLRPSEEGDGRGGAGAPGSSREREEFEDVDVDEAEEDERVGRPSMSFVSCRSVSAMVLVGISSMI